jgi:hypothetical protein
VLRYMPDSAPPPTYTGAWPFKGNIDRWQEVEFKVSHLNIWTGGADVGTEDMRNPDRRGFHMRGFHAITPETDTSAHYMWTMATNPHPDKVEAQYQNMKRFPNAPQVDIHVDVGPNRARRIVDKLLRQNETAAAAPPVVEAAAQASPPVPA